MSDSVPVGWKFVPLQDIAKKYNGSIVDGPFGSNLKTSDYVDSGVPVLQGKNVTNDVFVWSDVRYVSEQKAEEVKRSSVRVGDILMVKIGSVGYSAIVDNLKDYECAIIPANLLKISLNEDVASIEYVHQYLTSPTGKRRITDVASSTAQPALSLGVIKNFKVPVPPLPEQQKIASILTSVDSVIEKTEAQINKLKDLKKAMMQELLTQGIGHTEFKDSPVGRIPVGWEVKKYGEIVSLQYGKSPKNIKSDDGDYPIIGTGGVVGMGTDYIYDGESIVVGRKGTIDKPSFVQGRFWAIDTTYYTKSYFDISPKWFFYRVSQEGLSKYNEATGVPSLNRETLNSIQVSVPPLPEQQRIASILSSMDIHIEEKQRKLQQVQNLKKALMQDLLTGKVRVKV